MDELADYEILLGITGGIAAYKSAGLCSQLVQRQASVTVAMTAHAQQFVGKLTFSTLSGREVYTDLFETPEVYDAKHIDLTRQADLIVVAPATANFIAKLANGICDDLLTTLICSTDSQVLLAPAMNCRMWSHPATVRNIEQLRRDGCQIIGPESGSLACGDVGEGRMAEPEDILDRIIKIVSSQKPKKLTR
jgi:phosphopantothenoylcysteine synthetase/decarboxylase